MSLTAACVVKRAGKARRGAAGAGQQGGGGGGRNGGPVQTKEMLKLKMESGAETWRGGAERGFKAARHFRWGGDVH